MSDTVSPVSAAARRRAWIMASRPRTLPAAVAPVVVGAALAYHDGAFQPLAALAALVAALLIQIGSNFANDLGDYLRGTDAGERVGPLRVTTAGLLSPREVQAGMVVVFGLAALCGLYLVILGGWPILLIGILSIVAAMLYTIGPAPFGYYGLGDLAVFIFFGLVAVVGTYYVQAQRVTPLAVIAAVPMGCLITAILVVNNIRDVDTDRMAGKRTVAVLLGRRGARIEYFVLLVIAYLIPFILWLGYDLPAWVLLPLFTLPLAVRLASAVVGARGLLAVVAAAERTLWRRNVLITEAVLQAAAPLVGRPLNRVLAGTAQLAVWYGACLALGIVL